MFEPETEEEVLHFSESEEDQLDSDGSEYVPRGRNAKRAAAIKRKIYYNSVILYAFSAKWVISNCLSNY